MQAEEVKALLEENIPGSEVIVEGEGCDFRLTVISDQFEGVMPVKRQQMIYSHLSQYITSGAIHAVTMSALTLSERALSEKARQRDNQG
ncbi:MAG: BolA family protein [Endozoicomonas sp.]